MYSRWDTRKRCKRGPLTMAAVNEYSCDIRRAANTHFIMKKTETRTELKEKKPELLEKYWVGVFYRGNPCLESFCNKSIFINIQRKQHQHKNKSVFLLVKSNFLFIYFIFFYVPETESDNLKWSLTEFMKTHFKLPLDIVKSHLLPHHKYSIVLLCCLLTLFLIVTSCKNKRNKSCLND